MVLFSTCRISYRVVFMIYILFEILHTSRSHHESLYRCSYACEYGYTCQYIYTTGGAYTPACLPIQTDPVKLWTDETQIDLFTTTVAPTFRPTVRRTEWFARSLSSALNAIYRGERPRSARNMTESGNPGAVCKVLRATEELIVLTLELYLSLVRGSDHAHSGQEPVQPVGNQVPTTGTRPRFRHSLRPSGHHVRQSARQTSDSHTHRHLESPITHGHNSPSIGQQTVLRPFNGQSTFTRQRIPEPVNRVPVANQFENQLSDNSASSLEQLSASSSSKQGLTPVGSLSNNREKSVAEILDELVNPKSNKQTRNSSQTASTIRQSSRQRNNSRSSQRGSSQRQNKARNKTQRTNGEKGRSNNRRTARNRNSNNERNRSSRTNNSSVRNINRQRNSGRGSSGPTRNTDVRPRNKLLSGSERVRQVTETANEHGQEPVVSAILRDDSGYYFMFYPQTGDSGTRINISKPGFCTRSPPIRQKTTCSIRCTSDRQCPGDLKCCPKGCDLLCTPPRRP